MAYIECNLIKIEKRIRTNGSKYIVCTWSGGTGDINAPVIVNGRLNLTAAKARNVTLVKCLFPATEEMFQAYWNKETGLKALTRVATSEKTGKTQEVTQCENIEDTTRVGLCYERIPLENISNEIKCIGFNGSDGTIHKQNYINVIGWADEKGEWAEDITAQEMARNNLNRGLLDGTYWVLNGDEDGDNISSEPEKPKVSDDDFDDL